jgi:hypothetical protein
MVRIEELMEFATRRRVEQIAAEMGFPKATEYPDEVLDEVKIRCAKNKKRTVSSQAHTAAERETASTAHEDLDMVRQAAEQRAAGILVAMDSLTMLHCATRQFSDPNLQGAVDESRSRLKEMLTGVALYYQPENFLSTTPLATLGGSGSVGYLNSSKPLSSVADENVLEIAS